jgi:hypothetical protein
MIAFSCALLIAIFERLLSHRPLEWLPFNFGAKEVYF